MKLLADFHTHTKNSRFFHGKNSIEEMAIAANELGLKEIGITDHGYNHVFRTNKVKLAKAREIVDEINEWSKTKVLLGIEADIISEDGTLDIDNETLSMIDILLVGYHKMIKTDFAGYFGGQKGIDSKERATNAFVNAIKKYPITVLVHPDSILDVDLYKIGCACRDNGVMVEINNRHNKWTEKQMLDLLASECMFVVSSDAHSREAVGHVEHAFEVIKKFNIPSELVANVEFAEHERSEADKESDFYYGIYMQKKEEKERKEKELEEKRRQEFSNSLSNEMEEALLKIAKDKGIDDYVGVVETKNDDYNNIDLYDIKEADNLLKETQNKFGVNNDDEAIAALDDEILDKTNDKDSIKEDVDDGNELANSVNKDTKINNSTVDENIEFSDNNDSDKNIIEDKVEIDDTEKVENLANLNEEDLNAEETNLVENQEILESSKDEKMQKEKPAVVRNRPRVHDFSKIASIIEATKSTDSTKK